ncbi:MAG TPA: DUF3788 family protein [Opitutaceae bacterium]
MKAKHEMDPPAAFPDAKHEPDASDLATALGRAAAPLVGVLATLRANRPAVATEWQFSERSGWYQIWLLKKRRLLYLVPKRKDFCVSMILGGKAIALLKEGPFAGQTNALLKTAIRYPEGTMFSFDRKSLDPDLLGAFLAAKIAH